MFKAIHAQGLLFKKIIRSIQEFVGEDSLDVTANGMQWQVMEASHIFLISVVHVKSQRFPVLPLRSKHRDRNAFTRSDGNQDFLTLSYLEDCDTCMIAYSDDGSQYTQVTIRGLDIDSERLGLLSHRNWPTPPCKCAATCLLVSAET